MEDQFSDCPCKKQRVSNSLNRGEDANTGEEASGSVDMFAETSKGKQACANQRVRHDIARVVQDTMAALAENTYIRNREAGMQAIRDREAGMQVIRDREAGVQTIRDKETGMQAIRDRETGMQASGDREAGMQAIRERETGVQAIRDREKGVQAIGDREAGMQAMKCNGSSVKYDRTSVIRNTGYDQNDGTDDVSNAEAENCLDTRSPALINTSIDTREEIIDSCDIGDMAHKGKTVCENEAFIDVDLNLCSHSGVDRTSPARSVLPTDQLNNQPLEPQYIDNDCDQDEDELNLDSPEFLSDSGFINLFSNCRNLSSNPECLGVSRDCSRRESANKDRYSCTVNAQGDASAITQNASSLSSDTPPSSDLKIKSLILDNIFKYIPCGGGGAGGTIKHDVICRPSNSRFNLDVKYLNEVVSQNNINSLPPQILVHIFRYLSIFTLLRKVSLVCKYWYNWCRDQDLWKNINLMNQHKLTDMHLQQLVSFSDRVISVNLTDCRFVTNVGIRILLARCTHIQVLKLMRCFDITDEAFKEICEKKLCSQLRCLRLDGCCKLNDATIVKVAKACPLLQILHINQCTRMTDHSIKVLADHCPRLTQLLMDHCSQVTEEGIEAIVQGCPYMTYLNIMSCGVTDRGVKLLSNLKHLTNLDLSNIPRLTPDAVVYLSCHCRNLECINISLNSVMNDHCVTELARNLPKLKRLYCVSCNISDAGLEKIAEFRPTLEALDVGWCQDITDHGVCVISDACPQLDYFGLIRCDQVTVETVEQLVLKYPRVNYSTFVLESRRLLERAQREGFMFGVPVN